jgi:hypothetical protein
LGTALTPANGIPISNLKDERSGCYLLIYLLGNI